MSAKWCFIVLPTNTLATRIVCNAPRAGKAEVSCNEQAQRVRKGVNEIQDEDKHPRQIAGQDASDGRHYYSEPGWKRKFTRKQDRGSTIARPIQNSSWGKFPPAGPPETSRQTSQRYRTSSCKGWEGKLENSTRGRCCQKAQLFAEVIGKPNYGHLRLQPCASTPRGLVGFVVGVQLGTDRMVFICVGKSAVNIESEELKPGPGPQYNNTVNARLNTRQAPGKRREQVTQRGGWLNEREKVVDVSATETRSDHSTLLATDRRRIRAHEKAGPRAADWVEDGASTEKQVKPERGGASNFRSVEVTTSFNLVALPSLSPLPKMQAYRVHGERLDLLTLGHTAVTTPTQRNSQTAAPHELVSS
ncbi:hypothetical protein BJV77DRAFT_965972 [Russula vinacea]|nr:hypothetical protein BJV77DRAFT_965972 [Russula vinacea]